MNQRNLARIALAREHRFAEERAAESHAIETADKLALKPGLDRVAAAQPVKLRVERADAR